MTVLVAARLRNGPVCDGQGPSSMQVGTKAQRRERVAHGSGRSRVWRSGQERGGLGTQVPAWPQLGGLCVRP